MTDETHDLPPDVPRIGEQREPMTRLEEVRAPYNVVAAFPDLRAARDAIERLEGNGVEGAHISLLGAQKAAHAGEVSEAAYDEPPGDAATGALLGGATGAAIGAGTGLIIGLPGVGPLVAAGLWALFGSGIGIAMGGVSQLSFSEAWDHTFAAVKEGNVAVGVHTDDRDEVEMATEVLQGLEPLSVNRFDD